MGKRRSSLRDECAHGMCKGPEANSEEVFTFLTEAAGSTCPPFCSGVMLRCQLPSLQGIPGTSPAKLAKWSLQPSPSEPLTYGK